MKIQLTGKFISLFLLLLNLLTSSQFASAETPITLFQSYAGNINFVGTEATRRTQSNSGDPCAVMPRSTTNTATVSGIPAGATILAAHLYWAGSYSNQGGSTRTNPDYRVRFENKRTDAASNRRYTANYSTVINGTSYSLDFFSGVADVTSHVTSRGNPNGSYSFRGLSVNTAAQHCQTASVTAGWSLIIIYEAPSEDFRVINLYEGFRAFRGASITLNSSNFRIPTSPINGKVAHITWEGDSGNSSSFNGFSERLAFNGNTLSDSANPFNNQFNSISTILSHLPSTGSTDTASYGVDFDAHTINSYLSAGQTSGTTTYSSGGDLVLLSSEIISVTNTPVSDLQISKTHSGIISVGQNATYTIAVKNNGPNSEPGPIVVSDTLPAGLSYVSAGGSGWSCGISGQVVTCNRSGNLGVGASAANITLIVSVSGAAAPSVTNTATVSGTNFDNVSTNNSSSDTATIAASPSISLKKTSVTLSDPVNGTSFPKAIPGALAEYTLTATNSGNSAADNNSIILSDAIPPNTALYVNDISGPGTGPVRFIDGTPPSGLSISFSGLASTTDSVAFSNNGGSTYNYTPIPDAGGFDSTVTNIQVSTQGQFLAPAGTGSGNPSFQIKFRVKVK